MMIRRSILKRVIPGRLRREIAGFCNAACDRRLLRTLNRISNVPLAELQDAEALSLLVSSAGLPYDKRALLGLDNRFMNPVPRGMLQIPRQLSPLLIFLSHRKIQTILEIGTSFGYTFAVLMTYLARFDATVRGTTVDIDQSNSFKKASVGRFEAEYVTGTSELYCGKAFDLVYIDGDHSYRGVSEDYERVGRHARICVFHDINDRFVEDDPANKGGAPRFWREKRATIDREQLYEFVYHSEGERLMGMGVIVH